MILLKKILTTFPFFLLLFTFSLITGGCTGFNVPQPTEMRPYTLFYGGDQLGRDQLANRYLVAQRIVPIKGKNANEILSLLGQPQDIKTEERDVSEDWYYIYYKQYKTRPHTDRGLFLVRFYQNEVIDVLKEN